MKALVERGLLQRGVQAGRRAGLELTAAGQALQSHLHQHHSELSHALGAGLSAQERDQLLRLLQRLQASLHSATPAHTGSAP